MSVQNHPRRRRAAVLAGATALCALATGAWLATGSASAGTVSGSLYVDPNSQVIQWVANNPSDYRTAVIQDKIASQPQAHWLSSFNLSTVASEVGTVINGAASAGKVPVLSVYEIPNRDCGGASAGGATNMTEYQSWISAFAAALGDDTVMIVLETDSLALQTCLDSTALAERNQALTTATQTIKAANPNAKVYLDGGHSAWNGASDQATRLKNAGIQYADGFFTNVSNFQSTSSEAAYGKSIISALNSMGVSGKTQVIDTSRNGGAAGDWCADDNSDRVIGQYPTLNTGDSAIDGYLWVKPPGEADGCVYTAGSFQPSLAYSLASSAPYPSANADTGDPTTTDPTTDPTSASPTTTDPTSSDPTASVTVTTTGCSASYQTTSSWSDGFQGQVTVTADSQSIGGWAVSWTMDSGQSVTQVWNGSLATSGSTVTVSNLSWNGGLAAGSSAQFGFIATGTASTFAMTCQVV